MSAPTAAVVAPPAGPLVVPPPAGPLVVPPPAGPLVAPPPAGPLVAPPPAGPLVAPPPQQYRPRLRVVDAPVSGPRIVALGDSVSVGVGDADEQGWVAHLAVVLGGSVVNLASNGARARTVVAEQLDTALAERPAVATLMVGGNDVLRGDFDTADVAAAIKCTVGRLLATGCTVVLVLPPPVGRAMPAPEMVRRVLARRMDLVRAVSHAAAQQFLRSERLLVLDCERIQELGGARVLHIDRIHPSPLGHRLLAQQVAELLGERGFATVAAMSPIPEPPPLRARVWWLLVRGAPWLLRRSRDLLPQLMITVLREERQQPRDRAARR